MDAHHKPPPLPEVEYGEHLIDYMQEFGPLCGDGPVPYSEMQCWADASGIDLTSWEAGSLRLMSLGYVSALRSGEDPACPAPWQPVDVDRESVAKGMKGMFSAIRQHQMRAKK